MVCQRTGSAVSVSNVNHNAGKEGKKQPWSAVCWDWPCSLDCRERWGPRRKHANAVVVAAAATREAVVHAVGRATARPMASAPATRTEAGPSSVDLDPGQQLHADALLEVAVADGFADLGIG